MADEGRVRPRPEGEAERVDQEALAGAGLAGQHVEAGSEFEPEPVDQGQVGDGELEQAPDGRGRLDVEGRRSMLARAHDGSSSTLWRSRSQNGIGALRLDEPDRARRSARTSTTSPTASGDVLAAVDAERAPPSASTTRQRTVWRGLTTTERIAER